MYLDDGRILMYELIYLWPRYGLSLRLRDYLTRFSFTRMGGDSYTTMGGLAGCSGQIPDPMFIPSFKFNFTW